MSEKFRRAKRKGIINIIENEIESLEKHVIKSPNMKQEDKTGFTMYEKGKILKIWRERTGMTAKEFSEFHNIPYSTYIKWEERVTEIPQYVLELLGTSISHYGLFGIRKRGV